MDVVLPQTNAAFAGISSFQLILLQPVDLGSVGSEESSMERIGLADRKSVV